MGRKFNYLFDPVFLISLTLYVLNSISIGTRDFLTQQFLNNYFNDLLLVPIVVPLILFASKNLKFRPGNNPPTVLEIALPLVVWSIAFEVIGPFFFARGTADIYDVLAYCVGGIISWLIWNRRWHYKSLLK